MSVIINGTGSISGITTPVSAEQGGTGVSSAGTSGNVLTSDGTNWASSTNLAVGVGQTWQNLTASRAFNTTYTNDTGKPIMVYCHSSGTGSSAIVVNGVTIGNFQANSSYVNGNGSFIVPNGDTYRINSSASISNWSELR